MNVPARRRAAVSVAAATAICLPTLGHAQLQLRIEGEAGVQVQGNVVVVQGGPNAVGGDPAGEADPWWVEGDAAGAAAEPAPQGDAAMQARAQAQARLAQARRQRAQGLLVRELSRVREACPGLEPVQRAAVLAAAKKVVEDQAAGRAPLGSGVEPVLERALDQVAGPEAAVVYAEEVAGRVARQKAAAIAVIVEAVDHDALLDGDQRRAVAATLGRQWRPEWAGVAATALRQRITFSRLPQGVPDVVAAALDQETVSAWRARTVEASR